MFHLVAPQTLTVVALPSSWGVLDFHGVHCNLLGLIQTFRNLLSLAPPLHHGSFRVPSLDSMLCYFCPLPGPGRAAQRCVYLRAVLLKVPVPPSGPTGPQEQSGGSVGYGRHVDSMQTVCRWGWRGQGRNDSSRRQEGIGDGRRDPSPMWAQRSDGGEIRLLTAGSQLPPLGMVTVPRQTALFRSGSCPQSLSNGGRVWL